MRKAALVLVSFFLWPAAAAWAQPALGNNPLSRQGIGEFAPTLFSRNWGMGGAGAASPGTDHINLVNPGLLNYNRTTNFELGLYTRTAWISDGTREQRFGGGGPQYLTFAFPVHKKVTIAAGLTPYTQLDYRTETVARIAGTTDSVGYGVNGSGGTNRAFLAVGALLGKGFSAGLEASYLFGTVTNRQETSILPAYSNLRTAQTQTLYFRDFLFKPGVAWRKALDTSRTRFIGFGLTGTIGRSVKANRDLVVQTLGAPGTSVIIDQDTVLSGTTRVMLPTELVAGINLQRLLHWNLAADLVYGNYSTLAIDGRGSGLRNTLGIRAGAEWMPDVNKPGYFNLVTYRAGFSAGQSPFVYQNNQLMDYSASLGATFPILRKEARYMRPSINLAVVGGIRSTTAGATLREQYVRVVLGVTLNDNLWFLRYKLD